MDFDNMFSLLIGLPKSIYINLKFLKFKDAIKLPILVSHRVVFSSKLYGSIKIKEPIKTGIIKLGFGDVAIFDKKRARSILKLSGGSITFNGKTNLSHGFKLSVSGDLIIGENFLISAETSIICNKKIVIGNNVLFSWDILMMDTDFHSIKNLDGQIINEDKEVIIGNNIWVGCRTTILKGTEIEDGVVVAANSCVHSKIKGKNKIIGGSPTKILKNDITWEM